MRISVIVPVYNVEKFLPVCIESVLGQTMPAAKIILVDDGSTDSSGKICDEYAREYPQIQVVHKKNAGLGMARNTGLDYVDTEYVAFLDSDDFWSPEMLEKAAECFDRYDCDTCKMSFNRVDMEGKPVKPMPVSPAVFTGEAVRQELLPRFVGSAPEKKDSIPMSACATVYSMEIIRNHDLRFVSEREWISEDMVFNIRYYLHAKGVALSDYLGYNYRVNVNSLTTKYMADRFEKVCVFYEKEKKLLMDAGLYELCKFRMMRQFFIYLRACLDQLRPEVCGLTKDEVLKKMKEMCGDHRVQEIISGFPARKMGIRQQIFVYAVKYSRVRFLYGYLIR